MLELKPTELEKVVLVGVIFPKQDKRIVFDHLEELKLLCKTAGGEVVKIFIQDLKQPNPAYLIGKGKAEEIAQFVQENNISAVIFDDELTPTQVRNLENLTKCKVLDRSAVILDIFASHARTREAKTQVELAQYEYFLPRLTRQWTHLSKQFGGIGTKGPGETQIETDRRIIKRKITTLQNKLKEIDTQRNTQRKHREKFFKVVLAGYTNAGKSTLLNLLTNANVLVEDKLFATLDSTTRLVRTKNGFEFLLSDTVGFIRKLPHNLIASFRSTLIEIVYADLILHIVDASHPAREEQIHVVEETLDEIHADKSKSLIVFNKIDLLKSKDEIELLSMKYPDAVFISAERSININSLIERIERIIEQNYVQDEIILSPNEAEKLTTIQKYVDSMESYFENDLIKVKFRAKKDDYYRLIKLLKNEFNEENLEWEVNQV
ncbi:MAG: GTPase HflX [Ignavibacteria bacterium]|nr:GTPase HflX [Ignavibacteria bacterium]